MLEASARARAHARCGLLAHCREACGLLAHCRAASWLTAMRRAASWLTVVSCAVRLKSVHAPCGGAACATSPVSLYVRATQSRRIGSLWCPAHGTVGPMHHAPNRAPRVPARA
ncbi:hypothetical protein HanIR_Chr14g0672881 [Helianthus annuus]|nr:hypothetical protein HanIR_Chr14g0672881 [Helianthus annuus]